jgi:hypothetical protein
MALKADGTPILNFQNQPAGAMWDGYGYAIAARPVGGTRGASVVGDTPIAQLSQLEFVLFYNSAIADCIAELDKMEEFVRSL